MTPSERAQKLEDELEALAALCEGTAKIQHQAMQTGVDRKQVGIGPEIFEQAAKRIRHMLADLGPMVTEVQRNGEDHCAQCGEVLTGA